MAHRIRFSLRQFLAVLLASSACLGIWRWVARPSIEVVTPTLRIGPTDVGSRGIAEFRVANRGSSPIELRPGVSQCASAFVDGRQSLPAHSTRGVRVAWHLRDTVADGVMSWRFTMDTSDPNCPQIEFRLDAVIDAAR